MRSTTLILAFLFIISYSCDTQEKEVTYAHFSGAIQNPAHDMVYLSYKGVVIDSSKLNLENRFHFYLDAPKDDIYEFSHHTERQLIYLNKGDSLLLYGNNTFFDESLSFSGKGSESNNFLISLFLENENSKNFLLKNSNGTTKQFEMLADSIYNKNLNRLNRLMEDGKISNSFNNFMKKAITINDGDLKENYIYLTSKFYPEKFKKIPQSFYDFRSRYDFNDLETQDFYINLRLLNNYLKNASIRECLDGTNTNDCFNLYSSASIRTRAILLDSLTQIIPIKHMLYNRLGKQGTILANDTIVATKTIALLDSLGYKDSLGLLEIKTLAAVQRIFLPGQNVANIAVVNADMQQKNLKNILDKPTVIHSWRTDSYGHHRESHKKLEMLQSKYPNIDFIGITTEYVDFEKNPQGIGTWINTLKTYNYDPNKEFHIITSPSLSDLLRNYKNKVLFLNKEGVIEIGATLFQSDDFDEKIEKFSKKSK